MGYEAFQCHEWTCDRCKTKTRTDDKKVCDIWVEKAPEGWRQWSPTLCPECAEEYDKWIKDGEKIECVVKS